MRCCVRRCVSTTWITTSTIAGRIDIACESRDFRDTVSIRVKRKRDDKGAGIFISLSCLTVTLPNTVVEGGICGYEVDHNIGRLKIFGSQ